MGIFFSGNFLRKLSYSLIKPYNFGLFLETILTTSKCANLESCFPTLPSDVESKEDSCFAVFADSARNEISYLESKDLNTKYYVLIYIMETENKIVKLFIQEKKPKTIREISKKINSDYRITHTAVQRLLEKAILISETIGKSSLCELNTKYYGIEIYKAENERKEDILKTRNVNQLCKEIMNKTGSSFFIFLIFGSYAKKTSKNVSDIDIIFVSNEKNFEEKISNIVSLLPLKIHVLVFTEEEFIRMKDSKKLNVIKEVIENNIIIYGIENYYRLKNA